MDATDAAEGETTPAPPPPHRRLTRSTTDRKIAGVCGGLGAYTGIDPVVFRVITAASAILGGVGLLAYVIAWIVIPEDDDATPGRGLGESPRTDVLLMIVAGLVVLHLLSSPWHGRGVHLDFGPVVLAGIAYLLWRRHRQGRPAPWDRRSQPTPPPPPDSADTDVFGTGAAPFARQPVPPVPPRTRRRAWTRTTSMTVWAVILTFGVFAGVTAAGNDVDLTTVLATALVVTGAGVVVGAWTGGALVLLPLCALLALGTLASGIADVPLGNGAGDRTWVPSSADELRRTYRLGAGDALLDLRRLEDLHGVERVAVSVGLGELDIYLPTGPDVDIDAHAGAGKLEVLDRADQGLDVDLDRHLTGTLDGRIELDVRIGAGQLRVHR
jgi:phage shock protein PspC (stress-responsive transcriptional regulator)